MTVIDPNDTAQVISIIPRTLNVDNAHTFALTNEDTRITANVSNTKAINNAYIDYTVTIVSVEGNSYSLKITDDTTTLVVFRGKVFATAQTTQNYVINE